VDFSGIFNLFLNDNNLTFDAVHPADIQRFAEWVKGHFNTKTGTTGLSDVAVQSHLAAVSSYYRWRSCRDKTLRNPVAAVKYRRREPKNRMPLIDPDMVTAMGKQKDCELGNLVVQLLRGSGMRLAELVSLNRQNVTIVIGSKGTGKKPCVSVKVKGKGGKTRIVLIGAKAAKAVMEYLRRRGEGSEPALILSSRKRRISRRTVQRLVEEAAANVGAGHCHPHELRHYSACRTMPSDGGGNWAQVRSSWSE
jgi:integrase/recombinase XerC